MKTSSLTPILYCILFERDPLRAVQRVAAMIGPGLPLPYEHHELVALIDEEIASGRSLVEPGMSPFEQKEEVLREFLLALRARLVESPY